MRTLYFYPVVSSFYLLLFFLALSQPSRIGCLPFFYTWCGPSANLECRSEMCCTQLAGNAGPKKSPQIRHLGTITQLVGLYNLLDCIFATKACIDNQKKLLNSNISPRCPHNMVIFGPITAEICSGVWGTPANFNGFRVLAALLHSTVVMGVSQALRHWTEGATKGTWAVKLWSNKVLQFLTGGDC